MSILKQLQTYILPKEIDFFSNLIEHTSIVEEVINTLSKIYISREADESLLNQKIENSYNLRQKNLYELNSVLITPVDKEAISRAYLQLDWVILSAKHLNVEIKSYKISTLQEYEKIFDLLGKQINKIKECFQLLKSKNFKKVLEGVKEIILIDDEIISEYSFKLSNLFELEFSVYILKHKEILTQLKEISKRIHICANSIEDFVFKMQ